MFKTPKESWNLFNYDENLQTYLYILPSDPVSFLRVSKRNTIQKLQQLEELL